MYNVVNKVRESLLTGYCVCYALPSQNSVRASTLISPDLLGFAKSEAESIHSELI